MFSKYFKPLHELVQALDALQTTTTTKNLNLPQTYKNLPIKIFPPNICSCKESNNHGYQINCRSLELSYQSTQIKVFSFMSPIIISSFLNTLYHYQYDSCRAISRFFVFEGVPKSLTRLSKFHALILCLMHVVLFVFCGNFFTNLQCHYSWYN